MQIANEVIRIPEGGNFGRKALAIGIAGLAVSGAGYFVHAPQFFHSYLTAYVYWITIALGGLFFTMLHHLVNATWSVVLRRITESLGSVIPVMALLFIPVLLGMHDLYHWTHADAVAHDELLQKKAAYLNTGFFTLRTVIYFAVWIFLARRLYGASTSQDKEFKAEQVRTMRRISAPGVILFAFTVSFAGFDWLMSLDPHWYSTIFGVYVFAGSLLTVLAFMVILLLNLKKHNLLNGIITVEHYHDLGKLLFAFTIFWAYIAFSQYFLIWYANIPEETIWYLKRWPGSWKVISLILLFGQFIIPFMTLMPRAAKRSLSFLKIICLWLLLMHWVDIYWLVMPGLHPASAEISWMDLTTMAGIGGIFLWALRKKLASQALIPVNDPRLEKSIQFVNV